MKLILYNGIYDYKHKVSTILQNYNTYVPERQKGPSPFLSKLRLCSFLILNFGVCLFSYLYFN